MELKEKQKLYILFGIFGIAALVIYFNLLLKPQFRSFIANNREYCAVRVRVRNSENLITNEARIKKQHDELSKQVRLSEQQLAGHDEIAVLLEDFSSVAESSGVKILRIKPLETLDNISQAGGLYSEFPILIEARGGYHQCGVFVNNLESMTTFIRIDDVDIKGRSEDPRRHDIRLRVSTYITKTL
ncbi:MAG: type 4a pilus biogenesis protein PilO [Candidatus Gorgyraea atricola]|nr:type 4a pilus biogenesis protein PilO [Candidatus Gorgyraea atricola]